MINLLKVSYTHTCINLYLYLYNIVFHGMSVVSFTNIHIYNLMHFNCVLKISSSETKENCDHFFNALDFHKVLRIRLRSL